MPRSCRVLASAMARSLRRRRARAFCSTLGVGLDPAAQVTHALYGALYRLIAAAPERQSPRLAPAQIRALRRFYGATPSADANDGIVPTRSQTWGHVVHAAVADHLDVLGHFRDAAHDPPHVDWLVTGSGFDRRRFEALWGDVARFLVGEGQDHGRGDPRPRSSSGPERLT